MTKEPSKALLESLLSTILSESHPRSPHSFSPQERWRKEIKRVLENVIGAQRVLPTGSWSHGTAISGFSDVDHFVIFDAELLSKPTNLLERILQQLSMHLSRDVQIFLSAPTVSIEDPFDKTLLEYVPAHPSTGGDYWIHIGDSNHRILSNPVAHIAYLDRAHAAAVQVRDLVRLIKTWKYANDSLLSSLYLELLVVRYCLDSPADNYLNQVVDILGMLKRSRLRAINDPSLAAYRLIHAFPPDAANTEAEMKIVSDALDLALRLEAAVASSADDEILRMTSKLFDTTGAEQRRMRKRALRARQLAAENKLKRGRRQWSSTGRTKK